MKNKKCKIYHVFRSEKYDLLRLLNMDWEERDNSKIHEKCIRCGFEQEVDFSYSTHIHQANDAATCEICSLQHLHINESQLGCIKALGDEVRLLRESIQRLNENDT